MSARPSPVGIGVTLHNRSAYLPEALDSLLAQSYEHFRIVLVDDGSTDGTEAIARAYERQDPRVQYVRFPERQGMVAAWRSAFDLAVATGAAYFAWGSDHDRWHPQWLQRLVSVLDAHDDVVLAYPLTARIDAFGAPLDKPARRFETFGVTDVDERWTRLSHSDAVAAGDMVYGLMRVTAARAAGVFRPVLCPDRLLVAELTLRGQIRQVPEVLWYRRQFGVASVDRQRATLFAPGTTPPSRLTAPWYMHARTLWAVYGRVHDSSLGLSRGKVRSLVTRYTAAYAWRHYAKSSVQRGLLSMLGWPRWIYKRVKHGALTALYGVLVTARYLGITPRLERMCERLTGRPRPWRGHA